MEIQVGPVIEKYDSYDDYLARAPKSQSEFFRKVRGFIYVAIDSSGRFCFYKKDYELAHEAGAFPVTIYSL